MTRPRTIASDPAAQQAIAQATALLKADPRVSAVVAPQHGVSISRDGKTAIIQAGASANANDMVRAADALAKPHDRGCPAGDVSVNLTGSSALWANFNKVNHAAMIKSEVLSWPVTMIVLVIAFGSLVAAGLPLMLTLVGLLTAAGALVLSTHIAPVSIWALNFAMMFALALGIDYALFMVVRFRSALQRRRDDPDPRQASIDAIAETMGTAGKAIAFSGLTVLVSLSTVLIVPSPGVPQHGAGHHAVGHRGPRRHADPAARRARQARYPHRRRPGPPARRAGPRRGPRRTPPRVAATAAATTPAAAAHRPDHRIRTCTTPSPGWNGCCTTGARCCTAARGSPAVSCSSSSACWPGRSPSLRTGDAEHRDHPAVPDRPRRLQPGRRRLRPRRTRHPVGAHPDRSQAQTAAVLTKDRGVAAALPAGTSNGWTMTLAIPTTDASAPATGTTIDRLRPELPAGSLIGGAAAENHDLEKALSARTPLVFGLLIGLGFLLLLVALGSPLVAFLGVVTNLASIAAAFGVAKWIFQDGHLSGFLHFQPQGFVDAWAPLFFGAMLTGVAMDYTLFLLSAAREHYDRTGDPQHAMRMALRTSGRVVVAAAGVMVAVFLTFALSGPLAPKEMGIILAIAVFLDALCIRLILLPVVLRLTGHGAWHQPRWLARILPHVHFSH